MHVKLPNVALRQSAKGVLVARSSRFEICRLSQFGHVFMFRVYSCIDSSLRVRLIMRATLIAPVRMLHQTPGYEDLKAMNIWNQKTGSPHQESHFDLILVHANSRS